MTLALAQILHLGTARSPTHVLRPARAFANPYAVAAVATSIGLHIVALKVDGLRDLLRLTELGAASWAVVVVASVAPAAIGQAIGVLRQPSTASR
jgi:hypothetical protein